MSTDINPFVNCQKMGSERSVEQASSSYEGELSNSNRLAHGTHRIHGRNQFRVFSVVSGQLVAVPQRKILCVKWYRLLAQWAGS
jgi:hypothetical protein